MKKIILTAVVFMSGTMAQADQCAYITKTQAAKALSLLAEVNSYVDYCAPCGDDPSAELPIRQIGMRQTTMSPYWEVTINEKGIDLAYTYLAGVNLAKLSDCEAHDVPEILK